MNPRAGGNGWAASPGAATALAGAAAGVACCWLALRIPVFGQNIPNQAILSDYLQGWVWAVVVLLALQAAPLAEKRAVSVLWAVKSLVVLVVMLPYDEHYGTMDAGGIYWNGVRALHGRMPGAGVDIATRRVAYVAAAIATGTRSSYFAMNVGFAFIGLGAIYCFYRAACLYLGLEDGRVLYLIGLVPSVVFWSSTLGKDPVVFLGCGLYALGSVGWLRRGQPRYGLAVALGTAVAAWIRVWYLVILLAPLAVVVAFRLRDPVRRAAGGAVAVVAALYGLQRFARSFAITDASSVVAQANSIINGFAAGAGSSSSQGAVHFTSLRSLIEFWPWGAFTAMFRPMPWDVHNAFMLAPALESTVIILLCVGALKNWRAVRPARDPVLGWACLVLLAWSVPYSIGGYGNLGMAARERLEIMPFLALLALLIGTRRGRAIALRAYAASRVSGGSGA